ncbi:amidohydrolase [Clostridium sp. AF32-12BH]|uniref:amidohydrolase n=1 Tax=Clostridium sp. AF32-12BH TaxID=2292006 RepID=UPI000E49B45F|nr:amidohydrolase [Clostridium sp. AF32-12BH]RHP45658.1 amidohydrolase [Clostridium sp. AF32-12BH]
MNKQQFEQQFETISDQIWDFAETRYQEFRSSALQADFLEDQGFQITKNPGGIATAFSASFGSGHPVIGLLGEYDALPRMNQTANACERQADRPGAAGHGCGHNLLGTGTMEAACLIKNWLEETSLSGTVIYYGCPAEEGGAGKAFLTRSGCFDGLDFALAWHPGSKTGLIKEALANIRVIFDFTGKSAHAAAHPELGRSALDACELMNVGVNYLREHVKSDARMHYAYLNDGGDAPNIVPASATLLYALRAPQSSYVAELYDRVTDVAKGAALMTGTKVSYRTVSAYADLLSAPAMETLMMKAMQEAEKPEYTEEDYAVAAKFMRLPELSDLSGTADAASIDQTMREEAASAHTSIDTEILPADQTIYLGSTDVGDVSWQVPTGLISVAAEATGCVLHTWQIVAQGKSPLAHKGMHYAARILFAAAKQLYSSPELCECIQADYQRIKGSRTYRSMLPDSVKPGDF